MSVINTNIASLTAQKNLGMNQASLATAMQRLSSGLRINSAKDDAAGLAISERMTAQIRGSDQAARNANDGISLAQTAEGDLAQIGNNLQRMRELAVQSSNATNSSSDRAALDGEVQALSAEIDRVSSNSAFNGVKLLDGSFSAQRFQVGANNTANDAITIASIASARTSQLGGVGTSSAASTTSGVTTGALAAGDLTLNAFQVGASQLGAAPGQSTASATSIAAAINTISSSSGVTATANSNVLTATATDYSAVGADAFRINGINVGAIAAGTTVQGKGANVAAAINALATQTGVTAAANASTGAVTLTAGDGRDISVQTNAAVAGSAATATAAADALTAKIGFAVGTGGTPTVAATEGSGISIATTQAATVGNTVSTLAAGALTVNGTAVGAVSLTAGVPAAPGITGTAGSTLTFTGVDGLPLGTWITFEVTGSVNTTFTMFSNHDPATDALVFMGDVGGGVFTNGGGGALTVAAGHSIGITMVGVGFMAPPTADNLQAALDNQTLANGFFTPAAGGGTALTVGLQAYGGAVVNATAVAAAAQSALTASGDASSTITDDGSGHLVITPGLGKTVTFGMGGTATDSAAASAAQAALIAQTGLTAGQLGTQAYGIAAASATNHGTVTLSSTSTDGIVWAGAAAGNAGLAASGTQAATTTSSVSSIASMNVLTAANATSALAAIDGALSTVNSSRAALGAIQNRFTSVVSSLQTTSENLSSSRSRIQDADFAAETASLSRAQILQQAGTAMVAQANQLPQGVLALLR